jgi:hypothetical protein
MACLPSEPIDVPPARNCLRLHLATLIAVLLLALAAPACAQAPSPFVKYRVEIDAPLALADTLRSGLALFRWQG